MSDTTAPTVPASTDGKVEETGVTAPTAPLKLDIGVITRVTHELYVAGVVSEDQIRAIATEGFIKSIVNLVRPDEDAFLPTEEALCADVGLEYHNLPVRPSTLTESEIDSIMAKVDSAAKPTLVHCRSAVRAGAVVIAHEATRKRLDSAHALELAKATPIGHKAPTLRGVIVDYARKKNELIASLPSVRKVTGTVAVEEGKDGSGVALELYVGPQLDEEHFATLARDGIKAVLNIRDPKEVGSIGMGVLASEPGLVKTLGMTYLNVPTRQACLPSDEEVAAVRDAVMSLPQPVYLHCRTMRRSAAVVRALGIDAMADIPPLDVHHGDGCESGKDAGAVRGSE